MAEVICPHCGEYAIVEEINCTIFRHAVYKTNLQPINPHATKEECERLLENGEIYGCAKPFKYDGKTIEICDYI
jgi:hypothetical protein